MVFLSIPAVTLASPVFKGHFLELTYINETYSFVTIVTEDTVS